MPSSLLIGRLRKKLANASSGKNDLETVGGRGYVIPHDLTHRLATAEEWLSRPAQSRPPVGHPCQLVQGQVTSEATRLRNDGA
ncbi:hypothetical protein GCM10007887_42190 [Methylobacterium haplocladii]|nr:hypothetical protein GCM10007887_42190 [Methylobacterium haplocladii]